MELFISARFHALQGQETGVETALRKVIAPTRQEQGCLSIHAFRSIRDARLFYIHSRWVDEAAFDNHVSQYEYEAVRGRSAAVGRSRARCSTSQPCRVVLSAENSLRR